MSTWKHYYNSYVCVQVTKMCDIGRELEIKTETNDSHGHLKGIKWFCQ